LFAKLRSVLDYPCCSLENEGERGRKSSSPAITLHKRLRFSGFEVFVTENPGRSISVFQGEKNTGAGNEQLGFGQRKITEPLK
jgi:hypothetical protein